jgi:hypothetical protein
MNRFSHSFLVLICVSILPSCVKEITLDPFELPDLVQDFVRKVECFDQEKAALIATDGGVLLIYGDERDQVIYDASRFPGLNSINWADSEVLYSSATETFWVIQDSVFITLDRQKRLNIETDRTQFNISTSNYFDYTLSNQGELYRIGFYKELWAGSSSGFTTDLYIGLYKYLGNPNNMWQEYLTDMIVKSDNVAIPNSIFTEEGDILIATNPQFRVVKIDQQNTEFNLIGKAGDGFKYETMYLPYINQTNGNLYGMATLPEINSPLQNILTTVISENEVQRKAFDSECQFPEFSRGIVKLIDWNGEVGRFYVRSSTNQTNSNDVVLGYVLSYNAESGSCEVTSIFGNNELQSASGVQDLDVMGKTVYIGTRNGLFVYDLETRALSGYINQLLEYYL